MSDDLLAHLIWGAHAPSRASFGALAEILRDYTRRLARAPIAAREARALPNP